MNNATLTSTIPNRSALATLEPDFLQRGDRGAAVTCLQRALNELRLYQGECDGQFGYKTMDAVYVAQKRLGLEATGVFDQSTWYGLTFWSTDVSTVTPPLRRRQGWSPFRRAAKFFGI
ncbi:MAG: peptidoglycan-binding domain-containing protein [Limnothrix sp.]